MKPALGTLGAFGAAALLALLVDQASKLAVLELLGHEAGAQVSVIPQILTFRLSWNTGINFGAFANHGQIVLWVHVALAALVTVGLAIWSKRSATRPALGAMAGLLAGGALGNALDRLSYGAVVDFLNIGCCGWRNPYQFNPADMAIFIGAFGLWIGLARSGSARPDAPRAPE